MNREYLNRVINTLFNPLEYQNILQPTNSTPLSKGMHHAGALALGYGGLGLVLRKLLSKGTGVPDKAALQAQVAARFPTLSMDPNLDDEEEEQKIRELGLTKGAAEDGAVKQLFTGSQHGAHPGMAILGALAGGTIGYKLSDFLEDRKREAELDKSIAQQQNEIDKLLHEEYVRTRGLSPKVAADGGVVTPESLNKRFPNSSGGAGEIPGSEAPLWVGNPLNWPKAISTTYWMWVLAATAMGYQASKKYMNSTDPARKRMKQISDIARQRAKVTQAPHLIDESDFGDPLKSPPKDRPSPVTSTAVQTLPTGPATVSEDDPYKGLLQV